MPPCTPGLKGQPHHLDPKSKCPSPAPDRHLHLRHSIQDGVVDTHGYSKGQPRPLHQVLTQALNRATAHENTGGDSNGGVRNGGQARLVKIPREGLR